ncbi:hypothetical protein R6258_16820 [Halomonas sp. HP20-15]|uniref:hypothetical protein n=1 Tax=Halomonas sp. HP20-15 TaxID=3085901 RepID=UPI0029824C7A|nr:hypothetical protein [Halomonas sp. HP20-15]MDW5378583.1 hypothetical protein [Halomonas sp. HP20-15]
MNTYSVVVDFRRGYNRAERCLITLERLAERIDGDVERWLIVDRPRLSLGKLAERHGARTLTLPGLARGARLNAAANCSHGEVLVFIESTSDLSDKWLYDIDQALRIQAWDALALAAERWPASVWLRRIGRARLQTQVFAVQRVWFERLGGFDPDLDSQAERDLLGRLQACHARVLQCRPEECRRSVS